MVRCKKKKKKSWLRHTIENRLHLVFMSKNNDYHLHLMFVILTNINRLGTLIERVSIVTTL